MLVQPLMEKPDAAEGKKKQKEESMISLSPSFKKESQEEQSLHLRDSSFKTDDWPVKRQKLAMAHT
jgi:hypothetical protein